MSTGSHDAEASAPPPTAAHRGAEGLPAMTCDDLTRLAAALCGVPAAVLVTAQGGQPRLRCAHGLPWAEAVRLAPAVGALLARPGALLTCGAEAGPEAGRPAVLAEYGFRFSAAAALRGRAGTALGVLCAVGRTEHRLPAPRRAALCGLARLGAALLQGRAEPDGRAAAEALRQSEERFRLAVEHAPIGIALVAPDGRWLEVNPALSRLLGYTEAELLGLTFQAISHPDDLASDHQVLRALLSGEVESYSLEKRYLHRLGHVVWVHLSGGLVRDGGGVPLYVVALIEGIGDRKQMEEEREHLLRQETTARIAAEAAHRYSAFLVDAGRTVASSLEVEAVLQAAAEAAVPFLADVCIAELLATPTTRRAVAHHAAEPHREVAATLRDLPLAFVPGRDDQGSRPQLVSRPGPYLARRARGGAPTAPPRLARWSALVAPLAVGGRVVGRLLLLGEPQRRRLGAEELLLAEGLAAHTALAVENARLYREARAALEARNQMLDLVVHDLRSPIGAIALAAELLAGADSSGAAAHLPPVVAGTIEMIEGTAQRMNRLIQHLVDVRSLESDLFTLRLSLQPLAPFFAALRREMGLVAAKWSVRLHFDLPAELPPLRVDHDRLWQLFSNLLDNALRFTPAGGRVVVRAERLADAVCFSVADTGVGIAPENLEVVFQPFWRAYDTPRQRGTGLGLYIARAVAEAHGGAIRVESRPGAGSTFFVTLPLPAGSPAT